MNSSWWKCGVWLIDQWIPSHGAFVIYLHLLGHVSVDIMIILYILHVPYYMLIFVILCVCIYWLKFVYIYFGMIVDCRITLFLHDDCLCLISMFNCDIDMLIIPIDSLAMIILLALTCIFTLLYILFILISIVHYFDQLWVCYYLFLLYIHLAYLVSCLASV